MTDQPTTVGARLARARRFAGLEQADLAVTLNRSRSTISAWERGLTDPPMSAVASWAQLTGRTIDWIAYGDTPPTDTP